jgi:hypothetical protein
MKVDGTVDSIHREEKTGNTIQLNRDWIGVDSEAESFYCYVWEKSVNDAVGQADKIRLEMIASRNMVNSNIEKEEGEGE